MPGDQEREPGLQSRLDGAFENLEELSSSGVYDYGSLMRGYVTISNLADRGQVSGEWDIKTSIEAKQRAAEKAGRIALSGEDQETADRMVELKDSKATLDALAPAKTTAKPRGPARTTKANTGGAKSQKRKK